uniref:Transposase (Putative), gypsy type n=1 Tax=Tanacetum cinerariifolium TaxID=118510 RepID=A0A699HF75_TANCI|nr:transposase (putative), gypsy type [Tanacetum cinerariifolium]
MGRGIVQLETVVSTISQEYLLEFTSEYGIPKGLHPEFPWPEDMIVDFPEGKIGVYTKFFEFANFRIPISQFLFDIFGYYQIHLSQLSVIGAAKVSHFEINYMDLFNLISPRNPTKVKTGLRPCTAHEVPLLTATANRVIDMEDPDATTESSGTPSTIEKSPLDFDNETPSQQITEDHAAFRRTQSTVGGKSLTSTGLEGGSTFLAPSSQETPVDVSDPDPLSYATPLSIPEQDIAQSSEGAAVAGDPDSEKSSSFTSLVWSPGSIYQPGWGVTNDCRLDSSVACQDVVDHIVSPGGQTMKEGHKRIAKQEQRIQVREEEIKKLDQEIQGFQNQTSNLNTLLEAEADMKKVVEAKNADLTKELESLRTQFSDLQVSNDQLTQQVATLQTQVTDEERIKAAFEEFKKYEDDRVEKRWTKMDACLDALSIEFNEELYPHMLTAIAGRRWAIEHGLRLAVMKCAKSIELRHAFANVVSVGIAKGMSEGLARGIEHGKADRDLEVMEAYDPKANSIFFQALQELKDLKYPIVDQPEGLKDASMEVIMASLHLESDSEEDAPKSDDVPVSVPTVAPQGLAILLEDVATQTETFEDDASLRLLRSKSLPHMYNLDWP